MDLREWLGEHILDKRRGPSYPLVPMHHRHRTLACVILSLAKRSLNQGGVLVYELQDRTWRPNLKKEEYLLG